MKLERLHLKNFRCFDDLTLEFGKRLTVIIAENGAGKTALLDAIAIGFGRYLTKLPGIAGRTAKETDLRVSSGERREPFMLLAWEARTYEDKPIVWALGRRRDAAVTAATIRQQLAESQRALLARGLKEVDEFTLSLVQAEADQRAYLLPIIAYYGTNRAIREEVQRRRGFKKNFSRFDALAGALDPDSRFRSAFEWFNAMEDVERREREARRDFDYRHPELQTVRTAIERLLPGHKNPRTEIRPLRFVIDKIMPDGQMRTLRVSQLSDGYRVVLGLTMDLARRMAQANSRLAPQGNQIVNPLDLPAIALIDEVDLHLHPSWQQRIVTDLMQTFTNTQFILTTHSPQVLSTVKRENIRILGADSTGRMVAQPPLSMTRGVSSADLLARIMNVDPVPDVPEARMLADYQALIQQNLHDHDDGQALRAQLVKHFGADHPVMRECDRLIRLQGFKQRLPQTHRSAEG
ncbi:AAA family ATPase [Zoogloea sp.]|uniref:AAA family ATPase n=1 Tax=Zoogloea sp. TaxID=49181 RepID=UPI002612E2E0|nr:AAA family ATPase [Zoogloea sp.]MDD3353126.1 AAA family ATPase [Zoogloea sp.]